MNSEIKNILVPTDFSVCAQQAATVAIELAAKMDATIHFLHLLAEPDDELHVPGNVLTKNKVNKEVAEARTKLNELVIQAERQGVEGKQVLVFDKGNDQIEDYIKPYKIQFIVMGSHGKTGIRELVIGSNTQSIIKHTTVPVLVLKKPVGKFKFQNIVFASTFVEDPSTALGILLKLSKSWSAKVHILFVNLESQSVTTEQAYTLLNKLKAKYPDKPFTINLVENTDEEWAINQFADKIQADLIAITRHDRVGYIFSHCVAEDLIKHFDTPVLVLS
ncbi:universal stress protein [Chryseotalea sanaruensis]|uniref:Universal stress protein n=1 Tax=Chryseotalea sanaruensis TaxID=2482724 RepID=A0A401U6J1_9BACT|nr:universal stress protein [Chryseotalea sanaruensis]GCC50416.1 universal stress protein [Chryseotalea sanaruensis]